VNVSMFAPKPYNRLCASIVDMRTTLVRKGNSCSQRNGKNC